MAAPTIKQTAVTTSTGGSNTTVSVTLPTIVDGDSCVLWIGRPSNNLLTAGATATTLGFTRLGSKAGNSTTAAQGECWIATGLTAAAASGQTITFTSTQGRNWRAVAWATDPLNKSQCVSTGTLATEYTWGTTGGNQSVVCGSVTAPTEALMASFLFDQTNTPRSTTGTGWTEQNEGVSGNTGANTSICYLALSTKTVAASGSSTGATIARDDALNATGAFPFGQVALVAAASNILPSVTPILREVSGIAGSPVTFGVTATDPDGTIASYAAVQITSDSTITTPSLTNNGNGTFTFTPAAEGAYSFSVTATDNAGGVSAATIVSVMVTDTTISAGGVARVRTRDRMSRVG